MKEHILMILLAFLFFCVFILVKKVINKCLFFAEDVLVREYGEERGKGQKKEEKRKAIKEAVLIGTIIVIGMIVLLYYV